MMQSKPHWPQHQGLDITVAAAVATVISLGLIAAVTGLFQSRGMPLEELAAAARACSAQTYVSEREACVKERVATASARRIAGK